MAPICEKKVCFVSGCVLSENKPDIRFFHFPMDLERFNKWVDFCNNDALHGLTPRQCGHYYICAAHFSREAFQNELQQKLNRNSLPSLAPPVPSLPPPESGSFLVTPVPASPPQPSTSFSVVTSTHSHCATHLSVRPSCSSSSETSLGCLPPDNSEFSSAISPVTESMVLPHIHVTPRSRLFEYGKRKEKVLKRLQLKCEGNKRKLRDISHFKNHNFLEQQMSSTAATFLESQMHSHKKETGGRQWTVDEKIKALSVFQRCPKCYTFLCKLFVLPFKQTLISMINAIPFRTGINAHIFTTLAHSLNQMSDCDRLCYIMFDEMSLRENLHYNSRFDVIEGLEDYGHLGRTSLLATSALVFMLRGLVRQWKQPIAYYFSHSGMKAEVLKELIQEVLRACLDAGIHVIATVCDMGSSNVKALKELGSSKHLPVFRFLDQDIITLYDPSQLLICTRNCFLNHNVRCTMKTKTLECRATASWRHIQASYKSDKRFLFRRLINLTDTHINPDSQAKKKVQTAAQVFSHSVAVSVERDVAQGVLPYEALATASFVKTCDSLFDSFNGFEEHPEDVKPLKGRLEDDSPHWEFWKSARQEVNSWEFLTPSKIPGNPPTARRKPSQDGWLVSMKAMRLLWILVNNFNNCIINSEEVNYLRPGYINQDALENVFGLIRSHCGNNEHPTVWQFVDGLKTCIINGLAFRDILEGSNCMDDDASLLSNLQTFICEDHQSGVPETDKAVDDPVPVTIGADEASIPGDISRLSIAYVTCYIARRLLSHSNCDDCRAILCCAHPDIYLDTGIEIGECFPDRLSPTYPSENLVNSVGRGATLIDTMLDTAKNMDNVMSTVTQYIKEEIDFSWLCGMDCGHGNILMHKLVETLCQLCVPWWCTRHNREVKDFSKYKCKMRKLGVDV